MLADKSNPCLYCGRSADDNLKFIRNGKLFLHLDRIGMLVKEGWCPPICLEVHPTNVCNCICTACSSAEFRTKDPHLAIDSRILTRALAEFKDISGKSVLWSGGGEPFLYECPKTGRRFEDMLHFAHQLGLQQGIYSNGTRISKSERLTVLSVCSFIRFSLDAFSAHTYRAVHRTPAYDAVLRNIKLSIKDRNRLGSSTTIGISYVIRQENIEDLIALPKWTDILEPDYVLFRPVSSTPENNLKTDMLERAYELLMKVKEQVPPHVMVIIQHDKFRRFLGKEDSDCSFPCYVGLLTPTLAADGELYQCCHFTGVPGFRLMKMSKGHLACVLKKTKVRVLQPSDRCPENCRNIRISNDIKLIKQMLDEPHVNFV